MMPSKGYFATIPCVFYLKENCQRPHCHYRHSADDTKRSGRSRKTRQVSSCDNIDGTKKMKNNDTRKNVSSFEPLTESSERYTGKSLAEVTQAPFSFEGENGTIDVPSISMPLFGVPRAQSADFQSSWSPTREIQYSPGTALSNNRVLPHNSDTSAQITVDNENIPLATPIPRKLSHSSDAQKVFNNEFETHGVELISHKQIQNADAPLDVKNDCRRTNISSAEAICKTEYLKPSNVVFNVEDADKIDMESSKGPVCTHSHEIDAISNTNHVALRQDDETKNFAVEKTSTPPEKYKRKRSEKNEALKTQIFPEFHPKTDNPKLNTIPTVDSFTRWMKNKKLRRILGKNVGSYASHNRENSSICDIKQNFSPAPKTVVRKAFSTEDNCPLPAASSDVKIAIGFRRYYCKMFYEEHRKTANVEKARKNAVADEFEIAIASKMTKIYKNNCSLRLLRIRKGGGIKRDVNSNDRRKIEPSSHPEFTFGWSMYQCYSKYLLSEAEMTLNGFPRPVAGEPNRAFVDKTAIRYSIKQPSEPSKRICNNCRKEYEVSIDGTPTTENDCFYHWGRLRKICFKGQRMEKYSCCDGLQGSSPCESSKYHVWLGNEDSLLDGFVSTKKLPSHLSEVEAGIYSLDCEMCYTTKGLELARLTVVNLNEDVVFDEIVSLENPVLDFCTRFSGINKEKIETAVYNFDDVRKWVLNNFYDETILIGHSLENDLKALKLVHSKIVDTSVIFPHKSGHPMKMSLKQLALMVLELNIQENENGHDSKEDATICLKLMTEKIKEDSKVRKPRVIIGYHGNK